MKTTSNINIFQVSGKQKGYLINGYKLIINEKSHVILTFSAPDFTLPLVLTVYRPSL